MASKLSHQMQRLCISKGKTLIRLSILGKTNIWMCPYCERILMLRLHPLSQRTKRMTRAKQTK